MSIDIDLISAFPLFSLGFISLGTEATAVGGFLRSHLKLLGQRMGTRILLALVLVAFMAGAWMFFGRSRTVETWSGAISDAMCGGNHAAMGGNNASDCTVECVHFMRSKYVLVTDHEAYVLSDQESPEQFAGQRVKVTGVMDSKAKLLRVQAIRAAP
ncbi:MAG: hypothetical protein HYX74_12090 [Acidobacteria bacterium]|nr:hypothetical protein [Acidobacteriota bacterium]